MLAVRPGMQSRPVMRKLHTEWQKALHAQFLLHAMKVETTPDIQQKVKHRLRAGDIAQQHTVICTGQSSCSASTGADSPLSSLYQMGFLAGSMSTRNLAALMLQINHWWSAMELTCSGTASPAGGSAS